MTNLFGNLLGAINRQKEYHNHTGISALFNVVLNLFLIPKYSYIGASVAIVSLEGLVFTINDIYLKIFLKDINRQKHYKNYYYRNLSTYYI